MSREWMLKTLTSLGFTEADIQVYVYLMTEGPRKANDIAQALKLHKQQLYRVLRSLQNKGIVNASPEYPARYTAVLFERALDLLIRAKVEQEKALQQNKQELLSTWRSMIEKNSSDS
jgi:sugar-specific transcriptional regulator TrmB